MEVAILLVYKYDDRHVKCDLTHLSAEKRVKEVLVGADGPEIVADMVLQAANAQRPRMHYTPGLANRMRLLRRFATAKVLDAGVRKDLRLPA